MGFFKRFINQMRKPAGFLGRLMVNGINNGHVRLSDRVLSHRDGTAVKRIIEPDCIITGQIRVLR